MASDLFSLLSTILAGTPVSRASGSPVLTLADLGAKDWAAVQSANVPATVSTPASGTTATAAASSDPTTGLKLVFVEDFAKLNVRNTAVPYPPTVKTLNDSTFIWSGSLANTTAPDANGNAWATLNAEIEAYPNGKMLDTLKTLGIPSPLNVSNSILNITAFPMPDAAKAYLPKAGQSSGAKYISGAIDSYPYGFQYGYCEASIKMPPAGVSQGLWPAFWLLSAGNTSWPPEIDIVEQISNNTNVFQSIHTQDAAWGAANNKGSTNLTTGTPEAGLSDAFHTYGVLWTASSISFYFDRKLTYTIPTPSDMHIPMRILLNLAVGGVGDWPGTVDATSVFPSTMQVDYVKVWQ